MSIFVDHAALKHLLKKLKDVLISSPADGQVLTYEASSKKWKNKAGAGYDPLARMSLGSIFGTTFLAQVIGSGYLQYNNELDCEPRTGATADSCYEPYWVLPTYWNRNVEVEHTLYWPSTLPNVMRMFILAQSTYGSIHLYSDLYPMASVWFARDATYTNRILAVTCDGSARTLTDLGAYTNARLYNCLIKRAQARVYFKIRDLTAGTYVEATHTTNLPSWAANRMYLKLGIKSIGAADLYSVLQSWRLFSDY